MMCVVQRICQSVGTILLRHARGIKLKQFTIVAPWLPSRQVSNVQHAGTSQLVLPAEWNVFQLKWIASSSLIDAHRVVPEVAVTT